MQSLFARHLLKEDVLAELRADRTLSPRLRAAAMEIAERRTENASRIYEAAWLTIVRPVGSPRTTAWPSAGSRPPAASRPTIPAQLAEYRQALALALYRVDRPAEALETLRELAEREAGRAADAGGPRRHRHGRATGSAATPRPAQALEQLRVLVESGAWSSNQDAVGSSRRHPRQEAAPTPRS